MDDGSCTHLLNPGAVDALDDLLLDLPGLLDGGDGGLGGGLRLAPGYIPPASRGVEGVPPPSTPCSKHQLAYLLSPLRGLSLGSRHLLGCGLLPLLQGLVGQDQSSSEQKTSV